MNDVKGQLYLDSGATSNGKYELLIDRDVFNTISGLTSAQVIGNVEIGGLESIVPAVLMDVSGLALRVFSTRSREALATINISKVAVVSRNVLPPHVRDGTNAIFIVPLLEGSHHGESSRLNDNLVFGLLSSRSCESSRFIDLGIITLETLLESGLVVEPEDLMDLKVCTFPFPFPSTSHFSALSLSSST